MSPYPSLRNWIGIVLLCASAVGLAISSNHTKHQLKPSTYASCTAVFAVAGAGINHDLIIAMLSVTCTAVSLLLFWDRWKCNTMFCSKFCSGCANLSVLYVPIVAATYGVYRGMLKLSGR